MGFKEAIRTLLNLRRDQREREEQLLADTRADIFAQWEEDTWCGAFPDKESRDAWLAKRRDWREEFTGSIDEFNARDVA